MFDLNTLNLEYDSQFPDSESEIQWALIEQDMQEADENIKRFEQWLLNKQEPLPAEFQKVFDDNRWDLYEKSD